MRCRHYFSFVLVAFLSFFFGSFIITDNTFAVDDVVYTLERPSAGSVSYDFCNNSSSSLPSCSDFSYVIFQPTRYSADYFSLSSNIATFRLPNFSDTILYLSSTFSLLRFQYYASSAMSSLTVTLTNSLPGSTVPPSGNLDITSNGTYDVTNYATATVNVPAEVIQGDYHDDLVNINQSIIVCGAILLVLYFFYCIYRLIIKNSGVH